LARFSAALFLFLLPIHLSSFPGAFLCCRPCVLCHRPAPFSRVDTCRLNPVLSGIVAR
jgi:hypothetical protein